jgi:DNA-binding CsgD family transcriptional regulator
LPQAPASRGNPFGLTAREIEVLRLVTLGLTTTQIADSLIISPRTADAHLRSIYSKLDVTSRSAATRSAIVHKLV